MSEILEQDAAIHGIGTVAGRYLIGRQTMNPGVNLFACRLRSISTGEFTVVAPVIPTLGETISASFGPFGTLKGHVLRQTDEGFAVLLKLDPEARLALSMRMKAFRNRAWTGLHERRADRRFMPREPRTIIARPDGWAQPCLIVDYSTSGAAISAAFQPDVGEVVSIGQVTAEVVRLFDVGFAVRFFEKQDAGDIESRLEAPEDWRRAIQHFRARHRPADEPDLFGTHDWSGTV